jgi:hypothetical protein
MPRITLKHTLAVALATSALVVPVTAAQASAGLDRYTAGTSSLAGTTEQQDLRGEHAQDAARLAAQAQDLRGEHAQDAARLASQAQIDRGEHVRHAFFLRRQATQDLRGEHAQDAARFNGQTPQPPVYWSYTYQAPKPPAQPVSAPAHKPNSDVDVWLILAIALGAAGLVAGTALLVTRHGRVRVPA